MTDKIPHERNYRCRKLESDMENLDLEIAQTQDWTQDKTVRWDLRAAGKYLLMPLIKLNRYLASINHKVAHFNDRCDQKDYLRDIKRDE